MLTRILAMACLLGALAACDAPQESNAAAPVPEQVGPVNGTKTISAVPQHFDRVRAEQFEKEEERLRRRARD